MTAEKIEKETDYKIAKNVFSREGYVFIGWKEANNTENVYDDEGTIENVTRNIELVAQWVANYVKYYADFDGTEGVDGIIYADLLAEAGTSGRAFGNSYNIPKTVNSMNVKSYIVDGTYTDSNFGTNKIVKPVAGTTGEDRFYVMKLTDEGWSGFLGGSGTAFGTGKSNCDVTGSGTWFRPSRDELTKFIGEFGISYSNLRGLTGGQYWTSTKLGSASKCYLWMQGMQYAYNYDNGATVRLSATF